MLKQVASALVIVAGQAAAADDLSFCWQGNGGYTMVGQMTIAANAMSQPVVTEQDLTAFKIAGYRDGHLIGTWDMADADKHSTWHLRFNPQTMTFLTGHSFPATKSQGWNANGGVRNCGAPGFGFNSGNAGQDICVNGEFIAESTVAPDTVLQATTGHVSPDCSTTMLYGKSTKPNHSD